MTFITEGLRTKRFNFLHSRTNMGCCYVVYYEGINNGHRHIPLKVPNIEKDLMLGF